MYSGAATAFRQRSLNVMRSLENPYRLKEKILSFNFLASRKINGTQPTHVFLLHKAYSTCIISRRFPMKPYVFSWSTAGPLKLAQCRSCDNTLENCFSQISSSHVQM